MDCIDIIVYFTLPLVVQLDSGQTPPIQWTSTRLWSFVLDSAGCPVIVQYDNVNDSVTMQPPFNYKNHSFLHISGIQLPNEPASAVWTHAITLADGQGHVN